MELFNKNYDWKTFIRSIGVAVSDFVNDCEQINIGCNDEKYNKKVELEKRVNGLRKKYGNTSVRKGITLCDKHFGKDHNPHDNGIIKIHVNTDEEDGEE